MSQNMSKSIMSQNMSKSIMSQNMSKSIMDLLSFCKCVVVCGLTFYL